MSQVFVAEALHVTRQSIYSWESGNSCPTAVQLGELSALYCTCAHALLFGESYTEFRVQDLVVRQRPLRH